MICTYLRPIFQTFIGCVKCTESFSMNVVIEAVPGVAKSSYNLVTTKDFRDRSRGLVVMGEDARSWV